MSRAEFIKELEYLLADLPDEEKEDAIAYYRDYLDEAEADEAEALRELGSPERIAAIIRADIQGNMKDSGVFTERGFEDERFRDPNYQVVKRLDLPEAAEQKKMTDGKIMDDDRNAFGGETNTVKRKKQNVWKIIVLVLLVLAAAPMLLTIGGSLVGAGVGILTAVLTVVVVSLILLAVLTLAFVIGGFALLVLGIIKLFSEFAAGLFLAGVALVMLAFGSIGVIISVWFYGKAVPAMLRGCVNGMNRLIHRRVRRV